MTQNRNMQDDSN